MLRITIELHKNDLLGQNWYTSASETAVKQCISNMHLPKETTLNEGMVALRMELTEDGHEIVRLEEDEDIINRFGENAKTEVVEEKYIGRELSIFNR